MDKHVVASRWALVVPGSLALGAVLSWLNVPAAWILAAIIVSGACALITSEELPLNRHFERGGRGAIGILAGLPLASISGGELLRYLGPGLATAVFVVALCLVGGLLLSKAEPAISRETGVLSMLAGGASVMPVLARDMGADFRYVALSQYLRLLIVSMTLPLVTVFFTPPMHPDAAPAQVNWWMFPVVAAIAFGGGSLGKLAHLPSPSVFGPMLLTVLGGLVLPAQYSLQPPEFFSIYAFLAIGWMCGGALSLPALKFFSKQLPATLVFIAALLGACAAMAYGIMLWLDITYFEAYLATSPGALETALALSAEGGAGAAVVAIQLIRLLGVLLIAGWLPTLLRLGGPGRGLGAA